MKIIILLVVVAVVVFVWTILRHRHQRMDAIETIKRHMRILGNEEYGCRDARKRIYEVMHLLNRFELVPGQFNFTNRVSMMSYAILSLKIILEKLHEDKDRLKLKLDLIGCHCDEGKRLAGEISEINNSILDINCDIDNLHELQERIKEDHKIPWTLLHKSAC